MDRDEQLQHQAALIAQLEIQASTNNALYIRRMAEVTAERNEAREQIADLERELERCRSTIVIVSSKE